MSKRQITKIAGHSVVLIDSITQVIPEDAGLVVISGSHGGLSAAGFAAEVAAKLYAFNDAGIGKNNAGIVGLRLLQSKSIAALALSHESAEIGNAASALEDGVVSATNEAAERLGFAVGNRLKTQLAVFLNDA